MSHTRGPAERNALISRDHASAVEGLKCADLVDAMGRLHRHRCERPFLEELGAALDEQTTALVLDLRALKFIDSTGLGMLVALDASARDDGFDFTVLCREGGVRRVLRETGLDGVLPLVVPRAASRVRTRRSSFLSAEAWSPFPNAPHERMISSGQAIASAIVKAKRQNGRTVSSPDSWG
jgi:anti-anti-sigma factor